MLKRMIYVWEAPIRFYHWLNVVLIVVLLITGFYIGKPVYTNTELDVHFLMGRVRLWHMFAAWLFIANFIFRLYWAWAGNEHAKFRPWRKGFITDGIETLKYYLFLKKEHSVHTGHNVIAQLTYFFVMGIGSVLIILTGLAMQGEIHPGGFQYKISGWVISLFGQSYTVRMFHHLLAWIFVVFIVAHLYLVIRQDLLDDDGTISSIISGHKYVITDGDSRHE